MTTLPVSQFGHAPEPLHSDRVFASKIMTWCWLTHPSSQFPPFFFHSEDSHSCMTLFWPPAPQNFYPGHCSDYSTDQFSWTLDRNWQRFVNKRETYWQVNWINYERRVTSFWKIKVMHIFSLSLTLSLPTTLCFSLSFSGQDVLGCKSNLCLHSEGIFFKCPVSLNHRQTRQVI